MQLVAETATPLSLRSAVATCDRADVADLRVGVFEGDPAALYAFGLDASPLPVLRQHGALVAWARSNNTDVAAAALDEATASPATREHAVHVPAGDDPNGADRDVHRAPDLPSGSPTARSTPAASST